ncbi:calcineurin-binding protein cabin-1-like isoform X2 [Contarinia nasturtii]|uniref:calcineurin-binding protein cabin-1-like isoform X2 n=1 Tax=Contarinia nasturtii TaxID=265458 RepID=UPI0012D47497|nr:calcineurin-binding protein cabin-1-like isoform X2 [Contarinia nasturtii]
MYRITAINNESETEEEDYTKVTKEAEETIIMSEYMRALKLQKEQRIDDALSLLSELLETEILFEVTKTHTSKSLISIKYNCYKNIALIHNSRKDNELALEFLLKAIELDDTDVYTVNKLGQIALNLKQLDIAQMAFEKCLKKNPLHWPSGDGILQILCQREEYNEAYGWALRWHDKNPKYTRALDVILEIREKFSICGLEYIENAWSIKFQGKSLKRTHEKSAFPAPEFEEKIEPTKPDVEEFKTESFDKMNWFTFGSMISKLYDHLSEIENGSALSSMFETSDFLLEVVEPEPPEEEMKEEIIAEDIDADTESKGENDAENDIPIEDKQENSNSESMKCAVMNPEGANSADGSTEDSDAPTTGDDGSKPATRPKSRRRGSDLKLLDPWFYWTNRKCSQRQKNKKIERMETDTTIEGLLKKTLEKYYEENFDDESPFHPDTSSISDRSTTIEGSSENDDITFDKFQELTKDTFAQLIKEIKETSFSVITLIGKWIECISRFWEQKIPEDILKLYLKLFPNYLNHHSLSTWNLYNENDFQAAFRITLFYLELRQEQSLKTAEPNVKNDVAEDWLLMYNHMIFHSGLYEFDADNEIAMKYQKRLNWLQYVLSRYEYNLRRSVNCLETIRDLIIAHDDTAILVLPNQVHNKKIDLQTINESIVMLERMINLNNVHQLYTEQKYGDLIEILTESIANTTKSKKVENPVMKLSEQFEIILESFWSLGSVEECLIWCERCLKYSIDQFSDNKSLYNEWAKNINFILTYVEAIILDESYLIVKCLGRYYARLIQSIVKILSNQLDNDDRCNSQVHPINLKTPWVILHHILQREEDMKSSTKRKVSSDNSLSNENVVADEVEEDEGEITDYEEDSIPKSISVFFTAHEYLGNRTWCTKDSGQFLLFIMDTVTPRLRTPYLERFRNEIVEYLEQVTYCLYRYPGKRARLKHLEKHESQNIELDWNHAIQLYDIYRPDKLPEFDDFKRDSITNEMEQLFQRIIAIIPAEIDLSTRCDAMEKFISGQLNELPKPLDILPFHINSIYYLLADYYFKNKEISKALKYYIADLSNSPTRFDAWAGLTLSKADLMLTKLSSCVNNTPVEMIQESDEVLRCFEQCLKIDRQQQKLWIEYGSYAYTLHSYCSRCLKQTAENLSTETFSFLEQKKEKCLKITHDCFITMDSMKPIPTDIESDDNSDDEKWLYHYMLGKVAEKRKEPPNVVIDHYLKSAQYLYENNATYPFKISSANPQNLALEALEIFYRITATIIKYLEQHSVVNYGIGKYFMKILKQQAKSPFAMSQAKINENILNAHLQRKRKLNVTNEETNKTKVAKIEVARKSSCETKENTNPNESEILISVKTEPIKMDTVKIETTDEPVPLIQEETEVNEVVEMKVENKDPETGEMEQTTTVVEGDKPQNPEVISIIEENVGSPVRRGSQESTATTTTQTTTTTSSDSTSTSSDSSSTSDSSSDSDDSSSEDDSNKDENAPLDEKRIDFIYKMCIKNLEECITRYPEHHKSIYRLVLIYMNGPEKIRDLQKCNLLLLGTYTTELGNQVQGLFTDRKNNNLFNGFWRNHSSEIERPGSFSAHLSKCVNILMQTLRLNQDYKLFLEIIFYMQRVPDADKRYIKDIERKDLFDHAMTFCVHAFKELLKKHGVEQRNDNEILSMLIEIYKAHKKLKNVSQKESAFSGVMVDAYKSYAEGKALLQENVNYFDSANKFCVCLTNGLKSQDKQQQLTGKRQTLEELGLKNLGPSLSKISVSYPAPVSAGNIAPTGRKSPLVTKPLAPPPVSTLPTTTTTTTISSIPTITTTTTSTTTITPVGSRPRGRPPGSKNSVSKAQTDASKNAALTSLLQPFALANLEAVTAKLDPTVVATVLALIAEPNFMTTVARFPDPTSRNTLLREYFTISKFVNIPQLIEGFNTVFNYLATALQTQTLTQTIAQTSMASLMPTSMASLMPTQMKATKIEKTSTVSKSTPASMSIFPTANKPHSSLTTSPSKPSISAINPSISATITPVSSSPNLLKSGASTVISVGSGQLTITPSISITQSNPTPTSVHLPQMPAPSFIVQKPKVRRSTGNKLAKITQKAQRSSLGANPYPVMPPIPMDAMNLPKSLSIIPSPSSFVPPKLSTKSPINVDLLQTGKPVKETKPKKKSIDGNKMITPQSKKATSQIPGMELLKKSLQSSPMQLAPNPYNFLSHYEQFISGIPTAPLAAPKPTKSSTVTSQATTQQPKSTIKVKQLEQLQGRTTPKITEKTTQKSKQPSFQTPNIINVKNPPMSRSPSTVLNAYGTTISSVSQTMATNFSPLQTAPNQLSANLQISPTKTLQQKLAERQRQFHDANSQSRPSSTSSAGSSKTRKSDTEVIVLD